MPKRTDIKKIMLVGSGPIVIGQGCEFDYSGVQACKALREEGYEIVLVNSNPATIMTDPEFADRTYIEPLTADVLTSIIRRERPDALLPTLGGQTALNLAMALWSAGTLERYRVELIGARAEAIRKAEDRNLFKQAMQRIGLGLPVSGSAHTLEEALRVRDEIGAYPLVIRPGFTLGGTGGGIAYDDEQFREIAKRGLFYSPTSEILVEESVLGWKEFELEVMRDTKDNCVIVCSIENIDPMGVHTGDSITVAPVQTLTDREYQIMRDAAIAVMREIGVETGGSNVQFAVNPADGRMVVIEMNPRVSRSSALASKATGFPIAKIAAKLAVGYTLDEIRNDITRETPACFEPTIDYVVTKIPRFAFEKFPGADTTLGTQMKSVGEAMSIGKNFKQSFQKALRSLETGRAGFGADGRDARFEGLANDELAGELARPNAQRMFHVRAAFRRGWSVEKVHSHTRIDPWFLRHMEELANFEDEIRGTGSVERLAADAPLFRQAKELGYSDRQIAHLLGCDETAARGARESIGLTPVYGLVDTCAAEFVAFTPYYYSTYGDVNEAQPSDRRKIMIVGGGPNRIGQGIEFDYCCVHAAFALRAAGFETIMVNSNPETVSTDYDTSDRLYFEPLTLEDVLSIYRNERCWGAIVQFGGQTPLNLAKSLEKNGVNIIGTKPDSIEVAEDRKFFQELATRLNILQPANGLAKCVEEAEAIAERIGYPVLMRPSFVLGGRAMMIVYDSEMLHKYMAEAVEVSEDRPVLIDHYLEHAIEVDVDCVSDGRTHVIGGIMEHIELAGVHSGDSACMIPAQNLSARTLETIRAHTHALAGALNVRGLMNVQYAVQDETVYILEVNPRASRTVPFVSKATGVPLAKLAALAMAGFDLKDLGFTREPVARQCSVKEAVFPFVRFPGIDIALSPEMKSTGEVMGIDQSFGLAFAKAQLGAGQRLPLSGRVFISVKDDDKMAMLYTASCFHNLGFEILATKGTSKFLAHHRIPSREVNKVREGRPHVVDMIKNGEIDLIINTTSNKKAVAESFSIRSAALAFNIPYTTTLAGATATALAVESMIEGELRVKTIQEYHGDL